MLVQFAKRRGAVVATTVSSAAKAEAARSGRADHLIRYDIDDFVQAARALPNLPGFAVIR
jgi:NADPH:quinone reductase-like Zn-dependent oxidoreductase